MFTKTLLAAAALAAVMIGPAHADLKWNGFTLNGFTLNGFTLNGFTVNGVGLQGWQINGRSLNGKFLNGPGLNVGGHQGVSLNGQVIAIEL